ncbi:MAG: hypothetical protein MK185_16470 [Saccharospirillaceae bacterium]|jgi:hypothetical protein|nr:hypothetical protein [Saccharospirillaceae bacterium]
MEVKEALQLVDRLSNIAEIHSRRYSFITAFVYEYFSEIFKIEKLESEMILNNRNLEKEQQEDSFKYLPAKREIHNKYWSNSSLFYVPCSAGSEPEHDWSKVSDIEIMETGDDDCPQFIFMCKYQDCSAVRKALLIKIEGGRLGIEHEFYG